MRQPDKRGQMDMISFQIIADSGDCRSLAFEALEAAKKQDFETASLKMEESRKAYDKAHKAQTELLFEELNGDHKPVNVLLVHSQDHLMNASLAMDLIAQMIQMEEQISVMGREIQSLSGKKGKAEK